MIDDLKNKPKIAAWNAAFERYIWKHICVKQYGWPEIDDDQWVDIQAWAAAANMALSLDECAKYLLDIRKDPAGKKLIQKLSKPYRGKFIEYHEDKESYQQMYNYCIQDVKVLMKLAEKLPPLTRMEEKIWRQTMLMNERGVPIDPIEVNAAVYHIEKAKERLDARTPFITDGEVKSVNQIGKIKNWIRKQTGIMVMSLDKNNIIELLREDLPIEVKTILKARQLIGLSTNAKFAKAQLMLCPDNRVCDCFQYNGAGTGREAGRGMQLQNLKRAKVSDDQADLFFNLLVSLDSESIHAIYGDELLLEMSNMVRSIIKAPKGKKFMCADFSSIEAIATPWLAGEYKLVDAFRKGLDQYKVVASEMFHVPYNKVSSDQRQAGKLVVLACGYAGGYRALLGMAENYGVDLSETDAKIWVKRFRASRPQLTNIWTQFFKAAYLAINQPGTSVPVEPTKKVFFLFKKGNLRMILPSGRHIYYNDAVLDMGGHSYPMPKNMILAYFGGRRTNFSGANLFQNAVQAICRDLLMEARLKVEEKGYKPIISVHDEIVVEVPDNDKYKLKDFIAIMTDKPMWAGDLPVKADGWEGRRYKK